MILCWLVLYQVLSSTMKECPSTNLKNMFYSRCLKEVICVFMVLFISEDHQKCRINLSLTLIHSSKVLLYFILKLYTFYRDLNLWPLPLPRNLSDVEKICEGKWTKIPQKKTISVQTWWENYRKDLTCVITNQGYCTKY